jgi:hypothetical protein
VSRAEEAPGAAVRVGDDAAGIGALVGRLRAAGPVAGVVVEATAGYEAALLGALQAAGSRSRG